jgi:SAM-dependent methyltransferase/uncharacterized protein YbaR (Trm112 family)
VKTEILNLLRCPHCAAGLNIVPLEQDRREIRRGHLACEPGGHTFEVSDGIIRFATGFQQEAVRKEIAYEDSSYHGTDDRLRDPKVIARFPETLSELWPHTRNFGPDFNELIDRLQIQPGAWVLDVGTGACWSSRLLAQRGAKVIAIDVNEAEFYGLKTSDILFDAHNIYFERVLESMTHLPFKDESLDCITFNAAFHHTPDMEQTLRECFRVLKAGGHAAMVNEEFVSWRQRIFPRGPTTDLGSHHEIPYSDFEKAVRAAGFAFRYHLAGHVRKAIENRFGGVGRGLARSVERFPWMIKQLNSAVILLAKPAGESAGDAIQSFANVF